MPVELLAVLVTKLVRLENVALVKSPTIFWPVVVNVRLPVETLTDAAFSVVPLNVRLAVPPNEPELLNWTVVNPPPGVPPPPVGALDIQMLPLLVRTFPAVPGSTKLMVGVVPPVDKIGYVLPTLVTALATAPVATSSPVAFENERPVPTATFDNTPVAFDHAIPKNVVDNVIAALLVELATVPENPLAVTTLTLVTVPVPPPLATAALLTQAPPMLVSTLPALPGAINVGDEVPFPMITLPAGKLDSPVPPLGTVKGFNSERLPTLAVAMLPVVMNALVALSVVMLASVAVTLVTLMLVTLTFVTLLVPLVMVTLASVRLLSVVTVLPSWTDVLPIVIGVLKLLSNLERAMFPLRLAKANGTVIRTSLSIHVQTRKYSLYIQHCYC